MANEEIVNEVPDQVIKSYIELKKKVEDLTAALQAAQKSTKEEKEAYKELKSELTNTQKALEKQIEKVKELAQESFYLQSSIAQATQSIRDMEEALKSLNSQSFEVLTVEQIDDINNKINLLTVYLSAASDRLAGMDSGDMWANLASTMDGVTAGVTVLTETFDMLGIESETVNQIAEATAYLSTVTQAAAVMSDVFSQSKRAALAASVANWYAEQNENAAKILHIDLTMAQARATAAETTMKTSSSVASKVAAAAQWLWNKAILANPIGAFVAVLALAAVGVYALVKAFSSSESATEKAEQAQANYEATAQATQDTIDRISAKQTENSRNLQNQYGAEILQMKAKGASAEAIAAKELELNLKLQDENIKASKAREEAKQKELAAAKAAMDAANAAYDVEGKGTEKAKELLAAKQEQEKQYYAVVNAINGEAQAQQEALNKKAELLQKDAEAQKARNKERQKEVLDNTLKELDYKMQAEETKLKLEEGYQKTDFASKQEYAMKLFNLEQNTQKEKLAAQLAAHSITEAEYNRQMGLLSMKNQEFVNNQKVAVDGYLQNRRNEILGLLQVSIDDEIKTLQEKFAKAREDIDKDPTMSKEDKELVTSKLNKEEENSVGELQKKNNEKLIKEVGEQWDKSNAERLKNAAQHEDDKLALEIEKAQKLRDEKARLGQSTLEDDAKLLEMKGKLIDTKLQEELLGCEGNAKKTYDAKRQALVDEMALYEEGSTKKLELENQLAELDKNRAMEKINAVSDWANQSMEVLGGINDLMKAAEEAKMAEYEEENESKKAILQERLDAGLISQEEFDAGVAEADEELDKKKAEIAKKQAIRDKAMNIFQATINTATSIMTSAATMGFPLAIPFIAIAAAMGALQIATIVATPLPKASRGMLLNGNSHAMGGIPIEAEGGEAIINRRSTSMFGPLLSMINEAGGGVSFGGRFNDGGFASRHYMRENGLVGAARTSNSGLSAPEMENAVARAFEKQHLGEALSTAVANQKIYVSVEEYRRVDGRYTELENAARI